MTVAISNFQSPASGAAWFVYTTNEGNKRATTNGRAFVASLQSVLRSATEIAAPVRTYDGTTISGRQVNADGIWGPTTYKALWSFLSARGSQQAALDVVKNSAIARVIPRAVVSFAAGVVINNMGFVLSQLPSIPPNALLPIYNSNPGGATDSPIVTTTATADEVAIAGAPEGSPIAASLSTPFSVGPISQVTPGRIDLSTVHPVGQQPQPTGNTPTSIQTGSGLTSGPIIAVVLLVIGVGILAYSLSNQKPSRRHIPQSQIKTRRLRRLRA